MTTTKLLIDGRVYDTIGGLLTRSSPGVAACFSIRTRHLRFGGSGWLVEARDAIWNRPNIAAYVPIVLDEPYRDGGDDDYLRGGFPHPRASRFWPANYPPEKNWFKVACPDDWWNALLLTPFDLVMLGALADSLDERDQPRPARGVRRVLAALQSPVAGLGLPEH